jgi:NADH-quinone oxidoreductase subunit C/D
MCRRCGFRASAARNAGHLRQLPRPYVMLYDLSAVDERLRTQPPGPAAFRFHGVLSPAVHRPQQRCAHQGGAVGGRPACADRDPIWPNANWYEREVWDLFGITIDGHPHPRPHHAAARPGVGHPLRKDYPARATEFDPFMLDAAKQDLEQEALRFKP